MGFASPTKINKIEGIIYNDNWCQFYCQFMSIQDLLFVFALMKCNYVAFGDQNKMKGIYGDCVAV